MIDNIQYIQSRNFDPYANLALEEYLMQNCGKNQCILYLWQNKKTVVIGRNQNPWKECCISNLIKDGGTVARRLSGGGAVYHDTGNLNFTFLVRKNNYNIPRQLDVIINAVRRLGIDAKRSGRNDILTGSKKFSGNAFYQSGDFCYHHGTIMVDVDTEALSRYLNVPLDKLKAKGVASVKSRVINLKKLNSTIDIDTLKKCMISAFEYVYKMKSSPIDESNFDTKALDNAEKTFSSWDWIYGTNPSFENEFSYRFEWGGVDIHINIKKGFIKNVIIYSDCLDTDFIPELENVLTDIKYEKTDICYALCGYASNYTSGSSRHKMILDIEERIKKENF